MAASTSSVRFTSVSYADFEDCLKNKDAENSLRATKQAVHVLEPLLNFKYLNLSGNLYVVSEKNIIKLNLKIWNQVSQNSVALINSSA